MHRQKFRFGVGSSDGPRSAVWSLVWHKHDAYVIATEAWGFAKVSFHLRTGEFSWGYTSEYFREKHAMLRNPRRDFERWCRPPQAVSGFTLPLRIYVANEALQVEPRLPTTNPINWYKPKPGCAAGFIFILSAPSAPEHELKAVTDLQLIKRVAFSEHAESLSVYLHHTDADQTSQAANRAIINFSEQFQSAPLKPGSRIYAQWRTPEPGTGSRNIMEIPTYFIPVAKAG